MNEGVFRRDGEAFIPSDQSRGPWNPDFLHGGPVVGLMAHTLQEAAARPDLRLARLTVDLLRPVPKQPLTVETQVVRPGKRLQILEGRLLADGNEVTRASALFLETGSPSVPEHGRFPPTGLTPPQEDNPRSLAEAAGWGTRYSPVGFHTTAQAVVLKGTRGNGHGQVWMRLPLPLIAGETTDPLVTAATLCDFGNGVGQLHLGENQGSINADVTLYLHRAPRGEWLGLEATGRMQDNGMGLVETTLFDGDGPVGRVLQATIAMGTAGS
ncbi:thioesterase family protein [Aquisalimonas sp.]|uniref:thioesterase family protein n=1 Tax=unclassified Aquisalimonas TaxID=2644645 RepID=UPI0025C6FD1F|nr:thioesterase family protein [Aquisalimonas sp.]